MDKGICLGVCGLLLLLASHSTVSLAAAVDPNIATQLQLLLALDGPAARQAYSSCKSTHVNVATCKIPCTALPGCAGCVETGGSAAECSYCLPGHLMTADKQCQPCPAGQVSKGGTATACRPCPKGQTAVPGGYDCTPAGNRGGAVGLLDGGVSAASASLQGAPNQTEVNACIDNFCRVFVVPDRDLGEQLRAINTTIKPYCVDKPGNDNTRTGRTCVCQQPSRTDMVAIWVDDVVLSNGEASSSYGCQYRFRNLRDTEPDSGQGSWGDITPTALAVGQGTCQVQIDKGPGSAFELYKGSANPFWDAAYTSRWPGQCQQVVVANNAPPIPNVQGDQDRFVPKAGNVSLDPVGWPGCWVYAQTGYNALKFRPEGSPAVGRPADLQWILSGRTCSAAAYEFLGPCPSPSCVRAPDVSDCKVTAEGGLVMRTAPCPTAPARRLGFNKQQADLTIPVNASFAYLDANSRQTSACTQFGLSPEDSTTCWVQGTYQGVTGWVPVAKGTFIDPLCTAAFGTTAEFLVSDNITYFDHADATQPQQGCALPTKQPELLAPFPSCFPGSATAVLSGGSTRPMSELKVGDQVAVRLPDGSVGFESLYAFGHQNPHAESSFVQLQLRPLAAGADAAVQAQLQVQASADHFMMVTTPKGTSSSSSSSSIYKRAGEIQVGDHMLIMAPGHTGQQLTDAVVVGRRVVSNTGLFAPLTTGGTIIVDGVVASVHSKWFADDAFDRLGLPTTWLHTVYQAALSPVRLLWSCLPRQTYLNMYALVMDQVDVNRQSPSLAALYAALCQAAAVELFSWAQGPVVGLASMPLLTAGGVVGVTMAVAFLAVVCKPGTTSTTAAIRRSGSRANWAALLAAICILAMTATAAANDPVGPAKAANTLLPAQAAAAATVASDAAIASSANLVSTANLAVLEEESEGLDSLEAASTSEVTALSDWGKGNPGRTLSRIAVCESLPTIEVRNGKWPASCRRTMVNRFCFAACTPGFHNPNAPPAVQCTAEGWSRQAVPSNYACRRVCNQPLPLPPGDLGLGPDYGNWPASCRAPGISFGGTCTFQCFNQTATNPPKLRCTKAGYVGIAGNGPLYGGGCPPYNKKPANSSRTDL